MFPFFYFVPVWFPLHLSHNLTLSLFSPHVVSSDGNFTPPVTRFHVFYTCRRVYVNNPLPPVIIFLLIILTSPLFLCPSFTFLIPSIWVLFVVSALVILPEVLIPSPVILVRYPAWLLSQPAPIPRLYSFLSLYSSFSSASAARSSFSFTSPSLPPPPFPCFLFCSSLLLLPSPSL